MRLNLSEELVRELIIQEAFYNSTPEFFFLKEAGANIAEAVSRPGGCTSCTEKNLIEPTILAFISHTVNMYLDCGKDSLFKFKQYVKQFKKIEEDFNIVVLYKENDDTDVVELLI